jgi:dimethylargininase
MSNFGAQSMVSPLARVIVRAPAVNMADADPSLWNYGSGLTLEALDTQHSEFISLIEDCGTEIVWLDDCSDDLCDAIFTHDPSMVSNAGTVLMRMGKTLRREEVDAHAQLYEKLGVPVLGRIEAPGSLECGDCLWLNDTTLIVGRGFRSNQAGIEQLRALLEATGISVYQFDLPVCSGESACLHLMSLISMLDHDLALIYKPLLPVALYQLLIDSGVRLIEAPADEFEVSGTLSLNVLALGPRQCIALAGFANTKRAMEEADCQVHTFNGKDLCIKCEGGPTCLTRPLLRK